MCSYVLCDGQAKELKNIVAEWNSENESHTIGKKRRTVRNKRDGR